MKNSRMPQAKKKHPAIKLEEDKKTPLLTKQLKKGTRGNLIIPEVITHDIGYQITFGNQQVGDVVKPTEYGDFYDTYNTNPNGKARYI